jgi:hypothetical protein
MSPGVFRVSLFPSPQASSFNCYIGVVAAREGAIQQLGVGARLTIGVFMGLVTYYGATSSGHIIYTTIRMGDEGVRVMSTKTEV